MPWLEVSLYRISWEVTYTIREEITTLITTHIAMHEEKQAISSQLGPHGSG